MKALSVKDPWATAILNGEKTIELRSWPASYFGDLLICASASPKTENSGNALCIVKLAGWRPMQEADEKASLCDFDEYTYSWILENVRPIEPFPVKGKLKFFDVDVPKKRLPKGVNNYTLYKGINEIGCFNADTRKLELFVSQLSEKVHPAKKAMRYAGTSAFFFLLSDKGVPLASIVRQTAYYGGALHVNDLIDRFVQKEADYHVQDEGIEYVFSDIDFQRLIDIESQEEAVSQIVDFGNSPAEIMKNMSGIKSTVQYNEEEPYFYFRMFYFYLLRHEEKLANLYSIPANGKILYETSEFDDGARSFGLVLYPPKVKRIVPRSK
ncbi:MAG: ASCH domain-containing protein [Vulcanimicrobiota bacterium]